MIRFNTIKHYLFSGISHVIPLGFDHILFIICIFIINNEIKTAFTQSAVFTIAHSITLIISSLYQTTIPDSIIELLIVFSILFTSIENILMGYINNRRVITIFLFGLIHGLGFANGLREHGIDPNYFVSALLSFNIGVEIAQLIILFFTYFLITKWFSEKKWFKRKIVYPVSSIIACISIYWMINIILNVN